MFIFKILKNIVIFLIKQIAKICLFFVILGVIILGVFNYLSPKKEVAEIRNNSYLQLDLSRKYNENGVSPLEYFNPGGIDFYQLLKSIDKAKIDPRIKGIFINVDESILNRAQIEEIGEKLKEFRKTNKKVYIYGANLDNKNYILSVYGDKIIMPPSASSTVNLTGYFMETPYFKKLSDLVGVKFNVIHVGDYKSYGENYVKDKMSKEYKENISRILDKVYENFIKTVSIERKIDEKTLNERILNGKLMVATPKDLLKYNMIDKLQYLEDFIKEKGKDNFVSVDDYVKEGLVRKGENYKDKIGIIYLEGEIHYKDNGSGFKDKITPESFEEKFNRALDDKDIKGIILRINSPGGSALASDIIYNQIKNSPKPIYISIGKVAASGGYYISSGGSKIFADKESLTGSIGVVSLIPNVEELVKKLDINLESLQKGKYASIYSLTSKFTEEDREKLYKSNELVYKEFLNRVSTSRNIKMEDLEQIAQGKVWLGEEAVKIGLIDKIGGLEDTIKEMGKDLKLSKYSVKEMKTQESINNILNSYMGPMMTVQDILSLKINKKIEKNDLYFKPLMYYPYEI